MDALKIYRKLFNRVRLFVLYWNNIVFVKDPMKVGFLNKLKANIFGGYLGNQWALYDLDMKKKKEYLSEFDWYRSRYINEPFDYMLNNKIITTEVLKQYIRVPEIFLTNVGGKTMDFSGNILGTEDILDTIKKNKRTFIKPFAKGKGIGVNCLSFDDDKFHINGQVVSSDDFKARIIKKEDWYLSEAIEQHQYANDLYDKTLNTIRIITLRSPETKELKVFFAVQRIGTSQTIPVDNGSQGGIVCKVDLETGRLSHGRRLCDKQVYENHPDSGIRFDSVTIPDWQETMSQVLELAKKFPYMHFIAWDLIKMPDGTNCIIEANTSSGVNIIQLWGGQRNGELGEFYRAHGAIK